MVLLACQMPGKEEPKINVTPYLTAKEKKVVNDITFEVQKVLDTINDLRKQNALKYVTKLDYPGWVVSRKTEKVLMLKKHKFVAYKEFPVPQSCIKNIGGAQLNVCHLKLEESLKKLGEAYDCDVKVYSLSLQGLREKVEISCSY